MIGEPCPWCSGTNVEVIQGSSFRWCVAQCQDCGAQTGEVRVQTLGEGTREQWWADAKERALAEWNNRSRQ